VAQVREPFLRANLGYRSLQAGTNPRNVFPCRMCLKRFQQSRQSHFVTFGGWPELSPGDYLPRGAPFFRAFCERAGTVQPNVTASILLISSGHSWHISFTRPASL
jgi:hypothetical protein